MWTGHRVSRIGMRGERSVTRGTHSVEGRETSTGPRCSGSECRYDPGLVGTRSRRTRGCRFHPTCPYRLLVRHFRGPSSPPRTPKTTKCRGEVPRRRLTDYTDVLLKVTDLVATHRRQVATLPQLRTPLPRLLRPTSSLGKGPDWGSGQGRDGTLQWNLLKIPQKRRGPICVDRSQRVGVRTVTDDLGVLPAADRHAKCRDLNPKPLRHVHILPGPGGLSRADDASEWVKSLPFRQ